MNKWTLKVIAAIFMVITTIVTLWLGFVNIVNAAKQATFNFTWSNLNFGIVTKESWYGGSTGYKVDRHYDSEFWIVCYVSQSNNGAATPTTMSCVKVK